MKYEITFIHKSGERFRNSTRIFGQYDVADAAKIAFENAKTGEYSDIVINRVKSKKDDKNNVFEVVSNDTERYVDKSKNMYVDIFPYGEFLEMAFSDENGNLLFHAAFHPVKAKMVANQMLYTAKPLEDKK